MPATPVLPGQLGNFGCAQHGDDSGVVLYQPVEQSQCATSLPRVEGLLRLPHASFAGRGRTTIKQWIHTVIL